MRIITLVLLLYTTGLHCQGPEEYCVSKWNTFGKVAIDVDFRMPIDVLRTMKVYFCTNSDITMQIWLPTGNRDEMELVWEYPVAAPAVVPGEQTVELPPSAHIRILPVYRMGVAPTAPGTFPMGMNFFPSNQGSVIVSTINYYPDKFRIGQNITYIELMYPYKFSISVCNDTANCVLPDISKSSRPLLNQTTTPAPNNTVPSGIPGPPGPMGFPGPFGMMGEVGVVGLTGDVGIVGETGYEGEIGRLGTPGLPGDPGHKGLRGDVGPAGPPGPKGGKTLPSKGDECECTGFRNPNLVLGMLVWALLLTLLIVIGLVIATRSADYDKTR